MKILLVLCLALIGVSCASTNYVEKSESPNRSAANMDARIIKGDKFKVTFTQDVIIPKDQREVDLGGWNYKLLLYAKKSDRRDRKILAKTELIFTAGNTSDNVNNMDVTMLVAPEASQLYYIYRGTALSSYDEMVSYVNKYSSKIRIESFDPANLSEPVIIK